MENKSKSMVTTDHLLNLLEVQIPFVFRFQFTCDPFAITEKRITAYAVKIREMCNLGSTLNPTLKIGRKLS